MKCSFCGDEIPKGTGLLFIQKTGRTFNFCSRKCEKNMFKLGRKPRNVKWTAENHEIKAKAKATEAKK